MYQSMRLESEQPIFCLLGDEIFIAYPHERLRLEFDSDNAATSYAQSLRVQGAYSVNSDQMQQTYPNVWTW